MIQIQIFLKIRAKKLPEDKSRVIMEILKNNNCNCGDTALEIMLQSIIQSKDVINWWAEHLYIKEFYSNNAEASLDYCNCVLESALTYLSSNDCI